MASATQSAAIATAVDALKHGDVKVKDADLNAGTVTIFTGGEKAIILKVVGYEGDHDIPVSQRPDKPTRLRHDQRPDEQDDERRRDRAFDIRGSQARAAAGRIS